MFDTADLLSAIESGIATEEPEVQWAMNLTAGWIGVYEKAYRSRCVAIGESTGLFKGEMVSKAENILAQIGPDTKLGDLRREQVTAGLSYNQLTNGGYL